MQCLDLIRTIDKMIEEKEEKIKDKKEHINSNYILAKIDFTTIDNMTDVVETLKKIKPQLDELQNRIIKRNKGE